MKKAILAFSILIEGFAMYSQSPNWGTSYQLPAGYVGGVTSTKDKNRNIINAGYSSGNCDFQYGSGTYTVGPISQANNFITKTDSSGNLVWAKFIELPTPNYEVYIYSMTTDQSANIYLTGRFDYIIDSDPGPGTQNLVTSGGYDTFVIKLDPNGQFVWSHSLSADVGLKIKCDNQNNICLLSQSGSQVDYNFGTGTYTLAGGNVLSKFDTNGNFIFAKLLGVQCSDFAIDGSNNYYFGGSVMSSSVSIQKLNTAGNTVWTKSFGGINSFDALSLKGIDVDVSGNVYCTGSFSYSVDFDPGPQVYSLTTSAIGNMDPYVLKLTSAGNFAWAKQIKGPLYEIVYGLQVVGPSVLTVGQFTNGINFDPGVSDQSFPDAYNRTYINRYDVNGNYIETGFIKGPFIYVDNEIMKYSNEEFVMTGPCDGSLRTLFADSNNVTLMVNPNFSSHFLIKIKLSGIPNSIKENIINPLLVYPNPCKDVLKLNGDQLWSASIYDPQGKLVIVETGVNAVDMSKVKSGVYFLILSDGKNRFTEKIVKE